MRDFLPAIELFAKAIRSGLGAVGALVDCGIPRQHSGEQWLTEFEEENEVLEVPLLSADFTDEPTGRCPNAGLMCNCTGACRPTPAQVQAGLRGVQINPNLLLPFPQNSRTNAGATSSRAVEETSEGASPPAAPSDVLEGDRFMTDAEFHAALAIEKRRWAGLAERLKASDGPVPDPNIPTITDVLAEHYLETYTDRKSVGCRCGLEVGSRQQHWDHQADLISGALKARAQAAEK